MGEVRPSSRRRRPRPPERRYRPFPKARAFIHSLWLLSRYDWEAYLRKELVASKGEPPGDIPAAPYWVYRDDGWSGLSDWLGTNRREPAEPRFLSFVRARNFAWRLSLGSAAEWRSFCRGEIENSASLPANVPADPARVYSYTWRGWADWLGYRDGAPPGRGYRRFSEAREFARRLGLKNQEEWKRFTRGGMPELGELPEDIPVNPGSVYHAFGFRGMGDWLGTGFVCVNQRPVLPFNEAREFARSLQLASQEEWYRWVREGLPGRPPRPWNLPVMPSDAYATKGFMSWGDFLGTGNVGSRLHDWRDYASARKFARSLSLRGIDDWYDYVKGNRPDLPSLPDDIPHTPWQVYGEEYLGIADFLGTGRCRPGHHRPFVEARKFARSLELPDRKTWVAYAKSGLPGLPPLPADIPACPNAVYKGQGWAGFPDWLGKKMRPFAEAREFARTLKFSTGREWKEWARNGTPGKPPRPRDIPVTPDVTYLRKGWTSWADFLGTGLPSMAERSFVPYFEAVVFARRLGFLSSTEWRAWCRGDLKEKGPRPIDIPADPAQAYRNRGWHGWRAFLGTEKKPPRG